MRVAIKIWYDSLVLKYWYIFICVIQISTVTEIKHTESGNETPIASTAQSREDSREEIDVQNAGRDHLLEGKQADRDGTSDFRSDGCDMQIDEPMSPGTLALLCDEKDTMFMAAGLPNGGTTHGGNVTRNKCTELYAQQESCVLTTFRNFLSGLITRGSIKGEILFIFNV